MEDREAGIAVPEALGRCAVRGRRPPPAAARHAPGFSAREEHPPTEGQEAAQAQARPQGVRARRQAGGRTGRGSGPGGRQRRRRDTAGRAFAAPRASALPAGSGSASRAGFRPAGRPAGVCRARSRHQQLPPAGRRAGPAWPVPRHRRLFQDRAAGGGADFDRPAGRAGHGPRRRGAEGLRRQARRPAAQAGEADRHRSLPRRRKRRRVPGAGRDGGRADARDHRPPHRGAAGGLRLRLAGRARHAKASSCSTSAAAPPRSR